MTTTTLSGKISYGIYAFVLVVGGLSTILGILRPVAAADCMATFFFAENDREHDAVATADQMVYFKAMGRMAGMLGTLFLVCVYLLGHSTMSCFLLFVWGCFNYINFGVLVFMDYQTYGQGSGDEDNNNGRQCMHATSQSVGYFALLELFGFLFSLMEDFHRRKQTNNTDASSSSPSEITPLKL